MAGDPEVAKATAEHLRDFLGDVQAHLDSRPLARVETERARGSRRTPWSFFRDLGRSTSP